MTSIATVVEYPGSPPSSYSVDNGYSDPETVTVNSDGSKTHVSSGTHYLVTNGGLTPGATLTPTSSISLSGGVVPQGSNPSNRKCSAYIEIKMLCNSITVSFDNTVTKSDGTTHCLIGMTEVPSMNTGALSGVLTNITWTPTGQIFNHYDVHRDSASVVPYPNGYFTQPNQLLSWPRLHWAESENGTDTVETVRCTATFTVNGQTVGSITAKRTIHVWCPYYGFAGAVGVVKTNPTGFYAGGLWMDNGFNITNTAVAPALESDSGSLWKALVVPEDLFGPTLIGKGKFQFAQTITPNSWWTNDSWLNGQPHGENHFMNNGKYGLDTSYPYQPDGGNDEQDDPSLGWPDNDTYQEAADAPSRPFDGPSIYVENSIFTTYTMYRPGTNSISSEIVPLHRYGWTFTANYNGTPWVGNGTLGSFADARTKPHPTWGQVLYATHPEPLWISGHN